jgi:two-component system, NarL family, nitrate/nitrite response regulator NarL
MADARVTVVVVDDHPFFRDGVSRGLALDGRLEVVGEAGGGIEALALIARETPDVAVVDYQMPDLDGIGVVHAIKRDQLSTRVLLVSAVTDGAIVFKALEEGAAGYISKESSRSEIIDGVMRVSRGETVIPPELAGSVAEQIRLRADVQAPVLTPRELEVLRGFAAGQSIPELAEQLFVAPSTVKTHTQRLYEKLDVSDRAAAVATAMRLGLLE